MGLHVGVARGAELDAVDQNVPHRIPLRAGHVDEHLQLGGHDVHGRGRRAGALLLLLLYYCYCYYYYYYCYYHHYY